MEKFVEKDTTMDGKGLSQQSLKNITPNYQSTPRSKITHSRHDTHSSLQPTSLGFTTPSGGSLEKKKDNKSALSTLACSIVNSNFHNSKSPGSKFTDIDSSTVQRQRRELQLMINELKDRDKELNEIVYSHHDQLVSWEVDRRRIITLEKQLSKYKAELKKRHDYCKMLKERLQTAENDEQAKHQELETIQIHLQQISEKANLSSTQVEELKAKNDTLQASVEELSSAIGISQAREQQTSSLLRLKDKDIKDANFRIEELSEKLNIVNKALWEYKNLENDSKTEIEKLRTENLSCKQELGKLKQEMNKVYNSTGESKEEVCQIKQEVLVLQKELFLAGEREKRKDSLLELSRSRQERTETELRHIRQLYENVQKESMLLKHHLNNQDDRLSVCTMSDFEERSLLMNKIDLSDKANDVLPSAVASEKQSVILSYIAPSEHEKKVLPATQNGDVSLASLESEDIGEMCTMELKTNIPSYWELTNQNINTVRVSKLCQISFL